MTTIHPTACVDASAVLEDGVQIGANCIVEADVRIGAGSVLRPYAIIRRYTSMGAGNYVDSFSVLGGEPQDLKFRPDTVSYLRIGDRNVFREHVTISRATTPGGATTVGSDTYWMTGSHSGHDSTVEDNVILVNRAALAGHTLVQRGTILSAHVGVHQFCWVGEMCIAQGNAITTQHVPPYCIFAGTSDVVGLNLVGLRRAKHITEQDRRQIKEAFSLLYRSGLNPSQALQEMDKCDWGQPADKFRQFVRKALAAKKPNHRGLAKLRSRKVSEEEE